MSLAINPRWFVVMTNPNCQSRAEMEIASKGYRTFLLKVRGWRRHSRRLTAVERPLCRYLFVEAPDSADAFSEIRGCNGVEMILSNLGRPIAVPEGTVEELRLRYLNGEWDAVAEQISKDGYPLYAVIRIMEGKFENWMGTITKLKSKGQMIVKLFDSPRHETLYQHSVRVA